MAPDTLLSWEEVEALPNALRKKASIWEGVGAAHPGYADNELYTLLRRAADRIAELERERDEARAVVCTTNITEELNRLTTAVAVAFHFIHTDNKRNYELERTQKECSKLIINTFCRIALPYVNAASAAEARVAVLTEALEEARKFIIKAIEHSVDIPGFDPAEHVVVQAIDAALKGNGNG